MPLILRMMRMPSSVSSPCVGCPVRDDIARPYSKCPAVSGVRSSPDRVAIKPSAPTVRRRTSAYRLSPALPELAVPHSFRISLIFYCIHSSLSNFWDDEWVEVIALLLT